MKKIIFISALMIIFCISLFAQEPYKLPPKEIIDIVNSLPAPRVSISPAGDKMLIAEYESMPSIAYLAQPLLRLAGIRITSKNNSRQQTTFYTNLALKNLKDESTIFIALQEGANLGFPRWSFDGKWLAFLRYLENGIELSIAETESGKSKILVSSRINSVLNSGFRWMPDNRHLLVNLVLEKPEPPSVPIGPTIQETSGKFSKVRTYQDLLTNPYDEVLFDYYAASQIVEIDVLNGSSRNIGLPGIYGTITPSPDGNFILVDKIKKPYSYNVPYNNFAHTLEIWDRDGKIVHFLAELPLADEVPIRGVPEGPRSVEWRSLEPAALVWGDALDEGNPEKEVPYRDRIMTLSAPFDVESKEIIKIKHRYSSISWLEKKGMAFITESDWKKKWQTTYLIDVDNPDIAAKKIFDLHSQDYYNNPGNPVSKTTKSGERFLLLDDDWIYLSGSGSSPEGDRPFLDRMNIKTMKKERLFHSARTDYESFIQFSGNSFSQILTRHESKSEPPNYYLVNLKTDERKSLTEFKDPAPRLISIKKQLIKYTRNYGVELSGTLYLPADYKEIEKLPLVIWAYPQEYNDPKVAGQVRGSPHRFTFFRNTPRSFFLLRRDMHYWMVRRCQLSVTQKL